MGGCLSSNSTTVGSNTRTTERSKPKTAGAEIQLRRDLPKWTSETAITRGALVSKRDEFWETAPSYEGRKEIWDALKTAADAIENGDFALAQIIIETAAIKVPNGTLSETYDELGNKYQVPLYCLAPPENLIKEDDASSKSSFNHKQGNKVSIRVRISDQNEKNLRFHSERRRANLIFEASRGRKVLNHWVATMVLQRANHLRFYVGEAVQDSGRVRHPSHRHSSRHIRNEKFIKI